MMNFGFLCFRYLIFMEACPKPPRVETNLTYFLCCCLCCSFSLLTSCTNADTGPPEELEQLWSKPELFCNHSPILDGTCVAKIAGKPTQEQQLAEWLTANRQLFFFSFSPQLPSNRKTNKQKNPSYALSLIVQVPFLRFKKVVFLFLSFWAPAVCLLMRLQFVACLSGSSSSCCV